MHLVTIVAIAARLIAGVATDPVPAEALARRIEQRHRSLGDMSARFVQSYRSGALGREVVERGVVSIKPPGRMLWEYREPEKKTFVSDGRTFYFYVPADRQVIVRDQHNADDTPALLLSGKTDILGGFGVSLEPAPAAGRQRLKLVPRQEDPEIQHVRLDVDGEARILAIEVLDAQGNLSRFQFDQIRENVGLPERLFRFEVPRGVEVITG